MQPSSFVALILAYRYWILIPLTIIEGPIVGFIAGALSRLGYFNPFFAFSIFIFRDIVVDALWYFAGLQGGKTRFSAWLLRKVHVSDEQMASVRALWDAHGLRTMFIGKISYGIAEFYLAVAGMVKVPYKVYFRNALIVALMQYGGLFLLGYIVGGAFSSVQGVLSNIIFAVAVLALAITAYYVFAYYMRQRALKNKVQNVFTEM